MNNAKKSMLLPFLLIFMLLPFIGDVIGQWILVTIVSVLGVAIEFVVYGSRVVFRKLPYHQEFAMLLLAGAAFGMGTLQSFGVLHGESDGEVFVYLGLSALLFYAVRGQGAVRLWYFEAVFYVGSVLLLLYLVSHAIAPGMRIVPECALYREGVVDGLATIVGILAAWGFCRSIHPAGRAAYGIGECIAFGVIALNSAPGRVIILFGGLCLYLLLLPLKGEYMPRVLFLLCVGIFVLANLGLLINYTEFIRLENFHVSLEEGLVLELLLSLGALFVWRERGGRLEGHGFSESDLKGLRVRFLQAVRIAGKGFWALIIFGGIHLWVGLDNFMVLFFGEKWGGMRGGILGGVFAGWVLRSGGLLRGLWEANLLAQCYRAGGVAGALLGLVFVAWIVWQLWMAVKSRTNLRLVVVVCGVALGLLLLMEAALELLPFYAMWFYVLICDLQPKKVKAFTSNQIIIEDK